MSQCEPSNCQHCHYITDGTFLCDKDSGYLLVIEDWLPTQDYEHCKKNNKKRRTRQLVALIILFAFGLIYITGVSAIQTASANAHTVLSNSKPLPAFANEPTEDILTSSQDQGLEELSVPITTTTTTSVSTAIQEHFTQLGFKDSPLFEQAVLIAQSCDRSGMDPYWFVVISTTESGAGTHCFKPFNAWGYGQYSWSSWEEAIPAFTELFVSGYGSGLNSSSHWNYCPPGAYLPYV